MGQNRSQARPGLELAKLKVGPRGEGRKEEKVKEREKIIIIMIVMMIQRTGGCVCVC